MKKEPETLEDKLPRMKQRTDDFLNATQDARTVSEMCRDFKDGYQWTDAEKTKLLKRGQSPIVINRIKPKVE